MGNTFFAGSIDDVRIYDVAILPEQVNNLAGGSDDRGASAGASPSDPSSTSNDSPPASDPSVPDTGYGKPSQADLPVAILAASAIVSAGAGLIMLYRQRRIGNLLSS